jgi:hypothetical protein
MKMAGDSGVITGMPTGGARRRALKRGKIREYLPL